MFNTWQVSISTFSDARSIIRFSVRHKNNEKTSPVLLLYYAKMKNISQTFVTFKIFSKKNCMTRFVNHIDIGRKHQYRSVILSKETERFNRNCENKFMLLNCLSFKFGQSR